MRKASLLPVVAFASATALASTSAIANPAGMALSGQRAAKPAAAPEKVKVVSTATAAEFPSQRISPVKNPIQYFRATIAEMPIGSKAKSQNPVMPPVHEYNDSIALSTPVGQPTPELYITTAQMAEKQGDIARARSQYQNALSTWPGHVDVLRAAARMEDRQGQLQVAENLYRQAAATNPQHAGALNDLGLCLARQGKLDQSVQVIEQAIQLQPDKALYRNNAATVLVEMRQDQRALAHLAAVHGSAEANYNFGQLLVQRGRSTDAVPYFQAAVQQNPQMESAHLALAKLQGNLTSSTAGWNPSAAPSVTPQQVAPQTPVAPQYAPQTGPQLTYPATARGPEFGASSYRPPQYYAPSSPYPATVPTYSNQAPRSLPPVASRPSSVQR